MEDNRLVQALHYEDINRFDKSNEILFEILSENPNDGKILLYIAQNYFNMEMYDRALEYCKQSLENGCDIEICNYLLGLTHMYLNCSVEAEKSFLEALRLNPQNAVTISAYSILMLRYGHEDKAIKLLDEAMRLDPTNKTVLHYKFIFYSIKENPNEQLSSLNSYMQYGDDEKNKLVKMGMYNINTNKHEEALENFRQAYLLDPTDEEILSIIENIERNNNFNSTPNTLEDKPLYLPIKFIDKIGGHAVVWIISAVLIMISITLRLDIMLTCVVSIFIIYSIYAWVVSFIAKKYLR